MDQFYRASSELGLSLEEIKAALLKSLEGKSPKHTLIIPPDFTRFHSNAGYITNVYYHALTEMGCEVDILPALGTHVPVTEQEAETMFGDIPYSKFIPHNWRTDVMTLGQVPAEFVEEVSEGWWHGPIAAEVNRLVMDPKYDLIISPGQVVPHEVIGMANHAKNLFVGVGAADMINKIHMVGVVYGM
jgi:nickel-dependent lactate racemase